MSDLKTRKLMWVDTHNDPEEIEYKYGAHCLFDGKIF